MRLKVCVPLIVIALFIFTQVSFTGNTSVYQAQKKLKELGYDPGPIDGLLGTKTRAALKAYQKDHNLPETGQLDQETAKALGVKPFIPVMKHQYQIVDPSELSFTVETESVFFTDGGRKIVGTIRAIYCEGQEIELLNNKIEDGFIQTKKYGKIKISPPPRLGTPYLPISITPEQKKELLKLKKKQ